MFNRTAVWVVAFPSLQVEAQRVVVSRSTVVPGPPMLVAQ
jgi:hypothetical protein